MIQKLSIQGFKSVRQLDLSCRRVNVFIGEPNTGKTNILEALAFWCKDVVVGHYLPRVLRVTQAVDLFWDQDLKQIVSINLDHHGLRVYGRSDGVKSEFKANDIHLGNLELNSNLSHRGATYTPQPSVSWYAFEHGGKEDAPGSDRLAPPYGQNLANLLYASKEARQSAARFFQGSGFRLNVDFTARRLLVSKELDDTLISFPYSATSETLRRMVFYHLALDTNRDAVLAFDEPEAHAFPPFTKLLAERIASDDHGNQFFLTTHSPYLLDSLLSKTPASELNVVLCRMEGFETKAYPLNETQIGKLMEWSMDAFFNFDKLLDF